MGSRTLRVMVFLLAASLASLSLPAAQRDLVVIRPGGPTASEEAVAQVNRLIREIAARAGWPADSARAFYFDRAEEALAHIRADRPGFVLTTPGFFLAHRQDLGLEPLNQVLLGGRDTHRYHIVARKGGPGSLEGLKGKTLAGSALSEPAFVERVVLGGRLDFRVGLRVESSRALSALRRLSGGEVEAVILDDTEYAGLGTLPFAEELVTIHSSPPLPNTGIFAVSGTAQPEDTRGLLAATASFCTGEEGAAICETYGITGFQAAPPGVFEGLIRQYDGGSAAR